MDYIRLGQKLIVSAALAGVALLGAPALAADVEICEADKLTSAPAVAWMTDNAWRYQTEAQAEIGYRSLLTGQSPWPDWFHPEVSVLMPGARFQMAMSNGQKNTQPGGFGTYDYLDSVGEVREYLAVLPEWKPDIDRIVTYQVKAPLIVSVGPIGPQVDQVGCKLYAGRFTQIQMLVSPADRINYLTYISERPVK
ncbi:hypothetical protein GRI43_04580 [Altererythrobacter luteolus]|uniref:Uncharacterized protein n=1 Tax=Pontixanthobacter luteolus TaxID=295089 RepID=A0A6I4V0A3_9SPHN|nr:hypothetical protein [Pontixanthobacter luteolus]MXP46671.1 hypothetical protein [Pontixanthobacter luteolus]